MLSPPGNAERTALTLLHYSGPPAEAALFLFTAVIFFCSRYRSSKTRSSISSFRKTIIGLLAGVVLTYAAELVFLIITAFHGQGLWPSQDVVSYAALSVLIWGGLFNTYVDSSISLVPYACSWVLAAIVEFAIGILTSLVRGTSQSSFLEQASLIFCAIRLVTFVILIALAARILLKFDKGHRDFDEEQTHSLLHNSNADDAAYGATPKTSSQVTSNDVSSTQSSDSGNEDDTLEKRQQKRLEKEGGWWGHLKSYSIFLPMIIPFKNRRVQAYILLLTLCMLVNRALGVLQPRQYGIIVDALTKDAGTGHLPLKEMLVWFLLKWVNSSAGLHIIESFLTDRVDQFAEKQLYNAAFKHVMNLSLDFHADKQTGEVIQGVIQADSLSNLLQIIFFELPPIGLDLVIAVIYVTHLFDFYIALIALAVGMVYSMTTYRMTRYQRPIRRAYIDSTRHKYAVINESIYNFPTVAYFNRHNQEVSKFGEAVSDKIRHSRSWSNSVYLTYFINELTVEAGFLAACLLAAHRVIDGTVPIGNFVVLVSMWGQLTSPLTQIASSFRHISSCMIDAERLLELFQTKPSVTNKPDAPALQVTQGAVDFEDVHFSYDPRKPALKDINFSTPGGQTIALVGETGGGKSTILKLLSRFYDVSSGSIRIDGQDLRDVTLESVREAFGVVPQDPALFNTTILENLKYANANATEEQVQDACIAAAIHEKIMSFPDQYNSKVGERGVKLSGGELQRIAIARVILKAPSLVLLDEATSAVDSSTENHIQESFNKLTKGRTTFVIAHRLSTIMNADMILVIENGRIIENGNHSTLLGRGGKYDQLWTHQTAKVFKPGGERNGKEKAELERDNGESLLIDISDEMYSAESAKQGTTEPGADVLSQLDGAAESCFSHAAISEEAEASSPAMAAELDSTPARRATMRVISPRPTTSEEPLAATSPTSNTKKFFRSRSKDSKKGGHAGGAKKDADSGEADNEHPSDGHYQP